VKKEVNRKSRVGQNVEHFVFVALREIWEKMAAFLKG